MKYKIFVWILILTLNFNLKSRLGQPKEQSAKRFCLFSSSLKVNEKFLKQILTHLSNEMAMSVKTLAQMVSTAMNWLILQYKFPKGQWLLSMYI